MKRVRKSREVPYFLRRKEEGEKEEKKGNIPLAAKVECLSWPEDMMRKLPFNKPAVYQTKEWKGKE